MEFPSYTESGPLESALEVWIAKNHKINHTNLSQLFELRRPIMKNLSALIHMRHFHIRPQIELRCPCFRLCLCVHLFFHDVLSHGIFVSLRPSSFFLFVCVWVRWICCVFADTTQPGCRHGYLMENRTLFPPPLWDLYCFRCFQTRQYSLAEDTGNEKACVLTLKPTLAHLPLA